MQEAVVFDNFFASATSTLMVIGYLFHGNDFEYDTSSAFEGMLPAVNNPNLFSILRERGYRIEPDLPQRLSAHAGRSSLARGPTTCRRHGERTTSLPSSRDSTN